MKKNRIKKAVAIILGIAAVIICAGIFRLYLFYTRYDDPEFEPPVNTALFKDAAEDRIEERKNTASDIEGLTQYDKMEMGLIPYDNSDSDGDGLSDKDEIEIFGTDPLKTSTAGDLYTDGYKIEHDMDINQKYDYKEEYEFPFNTCSSEIILDPAQPLDFNAVVKPTVRAGQFYGYKTYKEYEIYNFSNTLSINLGDINNVNIYIENSDTKTPEKVDYTIKDGNIAEISNVLDNDKRYYIYLVKKGSDNALVSEFNKAVVFGSMPESDDEDDGVEKIEALAVYSPALVNMGKDPKIYVTSDKDEELISRMLFRVEIDAARAISRDTVRVISKLKFDAKYNALKAALPSFEFKYATMDEQPLRQAFFNYYTYDDIAALLAIEDEKNTINYGITKEEFGPFTFKRDTFSFGNFTTDRAPEGNCLGLSWAVAEKYNKSVLPSTGEITINNDTFTWNLREGDEAENEILYKGYAPLYPYKNNPSLASNFKLKDNLSIGEQNFVEMITTKWDEGNIYVRESQQFAAKFQKAYKWDNLNKVFEHLDNGECIIMCYGGRTPQDNETLFNGHAVAVYDYHYSYWGDQDDLVIERNGKEEVIKSYMLKIWDCNHPGHEDELIRVIPYVDMLSGEICARFVHQDGYMFPLGRKPSVRWDSDDGYTEYTVCFIDDDFNYIYGTEDDVVFNTVIVTRN